jgi:hypothetical protein
MADSSGRPLSPRAMEQVFRFCELPHREFPQHVLDMHFPGIGQELIDAGALVPMAPADHLVMPVGPDDELYEFEWEPELQAFAAFAGRDGWVIADDNARRRWRLDLDWVLEVLATALGLASATRRVCLVPDILWDLGDLWVTRQRKAPTFFARRLDLDEVVGDARAALERRAGRSGGILLTSTRRPLSSVTWPAAHRAMPLAEVLKPSSATFAIDIDVLRSPYLGGTLPSEAGGALHLSPDNRFLTIHGNVLPIRGKVQPLIIRRLVDAWGRGERLRTQEVLGRAGSSADSLAKAFKDSPNWAKLSTILRQEAGCCWLEV